MGLLLRLLLGLRGDLSGAFLLVFGGILSLGGYALSALAGAFCGAIAGVDTGNAALFCGVADGSLSAAIGVALAGIGFGALFISAELGAGAMAIIETFDTDASKEIAFWAW